MEPIKIKDLKKGMAVHEVYRWNGIDMTILYDAKLVDGKTDAWETEAMLLNGSTVYLMSTEGWEHYGPRLFLLPNAVSATPSGVSDNITP